MRPVLDYEPTRLMHRSSGVEAWLALRLIGKSVRQEPASSRIALRELCLLASASLPWAIAVSTVPAEPMFADVTQESGLDFTADYGPVFEGITVAQQERIYAYLDAINPHITRDGDTYRLTPNEPIILPEWGTLEGL